MQVIDDPYNGNIFGRLGKGLGQGLSDQLPKEVERYRLSSGLKKFEQESQNMSPVQKAINLMGRPGVTAEHLYVLAPLLEQEARRREGGGIGSGKGAAPFNPMQQSGGGQSITQKGNDPFVEQENFAKASPSLKSKSATESQITPIVRKSDAELMTRAAEIAEGNIYNFPNGAIDALPLAKNEEDTRIANLQESRQTADVADAVESRVKQGLQTQWGKDASVTQGATDSNIPGTIQSTLERKLVTDLANPKNRLSEQELITKYAQIGKDIAKAKTIMDGRAASTLRSGDYSPEKIATTIKESRPIYEKADGLEEFQDIIANKFNLSSQGAASFAYPKKNEKINEAFKNAPKPNAGEKGSYYPGKDPSSLAIQLADKISPMIKAEDSILSYALEAKKNGLDINSFFNRLKQNRDAGIFNVNERQSREISKGISFWPALGDFWVGVKDLFKG